MKHECKPCKYKTDDDANWIRHKKTKKHLQNCANCDNYDNSNNNVSHVMSHYTCSRCNIFICTSYKALAEHAMTKCPTYENITKENDRLTKENDRLIKENDRLIHETKVDKNFFQNIATTTSNSNMNAMNFLSNHCTTAKPMMRLTEDTALGLLTQGETIDDVSDEDEDGKELDDDEKQGKINDKYAEQMIYEFRNGNLHLYLTNIVVQTYKKDDPTDQSIWNTDESRLIYVIKDIINKKEKWIRDSKGCKIKEYAVRPLLKVAKEMISSYCVRHNTIMMRKKMPSGYDRFEMMHRISEALQIVKKIRTSKLEQKIVIAMSKHFGISNVKTQNGNSSKGNKSIELNNSDESYESDESCCDTSTCYHSDFD
jgi:hypothetical protein